MLTDSGNRPLPGMEVVVEPPVVGSAPENTGTVAPVTDARPADTANQDKPGSKDLANRNVSRFYIQ